MEQLFVHSHSHSEIREVATICPPGTPTHRKDHITLSRISPRQLKPANCLQIQEVLGRQSSESHPYSLAPPNRVPFSGLQMMSQVVELLDQNWLKTFM
jgi:hypothetical protein